MYTNSELIERFRLNLARKNKSIHTINSFTNTVEKLADTTCLSTCNLFDIENFIDSLKAKGNSESTINQRIVAINQFFKYLLDAKVRNDNPSDAIEQMKVEDKPKEFKLLPVDVYEEIYKDKKIDWSIRLAIMVSLMAGLRTEEICNLQVDDIDETNKVIRVRNGKGNKSRLVGVSDKLIGMIGRYANKYNITEGYLIRNKQNAPMTTKNLQARFATIRKNYGFDKEIHIHNGRHLNATRLVEAGVPIYLVSQNLGHKNVSTTERHYLKSKPEAIRSHINNIW